jgi:hypothetical protein
MMRRGVLLFRVYHPGIYSGNAAGFADSEFAVLLYLAVAGHFYAAAWAEHMQYSLLFSASVLFFIIGNQISKFERIINPWILFILNALAVTPFIIGSHSLLLCIAGSMIFNLTLAPITRARILSRCKSKAAKQVLRRPSPDLFKR